MALVGALAFGLAQLGEVVAASARAQTAADAAALAAVRGGEAAARALAAANGARMVRCRCSSDPVEVTVQVEATMHDVQATARASAQP